MKQNRRSIRLHGYDYSRKGAYFITLCAKNRQCLFGKIADDKMVLNEYGKIVQDEWMESSKIRKEIKLDYFIVMPNHIHGIIFITNRNTPLRSTDANDVGATPPNGGTSRPAPPQAESPPPRGPKPKSLGSFVAGFKSIATRRINELRKTPGVSVWQRNYYDHIIRNENELHQIREYIVNNPAKWEYDRENPFAHITNIVKSTENVRATGRSPLPFIKGRV